ncbi:hypothetical protein CN899_29095 [Bacillus thuringiensis]|uniref:Uncharacterized protein n=1 Tax=Bacillus thuringiensis TaxID=1428 RepID=A0A9X7BTS9_BACTU|nr:hypothetical protein [Bacillus thuringiensis]PGH78181.1 hypothetical protein CN899_29095 [Bacillus thuringiensis]
MNKEKGNIKKWRKDLQAIQKEKRLKKKAKKKSKKKKYSIPGNTIDFMDGKKTYRKEKGVWRQGRT